MMRIKSKPQQFVGSFIQYNNIIFEVLEATDTHFVASPAVGEDCVVNIPLTSVVWENLYPSLCLFQNCDYVLEESPCDRNFTDSNVVVAFPSMKTG